MKDAGSEIVFEAGMKDLLCFLLVVIFFGLSSVEPIYEEFVFCYVFWKSHLSNPY